MIFSLFKKKPTNASDNQTSPTPDNSQQEAETLRKKGNAFLDEGNTVEASNCYRKALEIDPADLSSMLNLGYTLRVLNQLDEAKALLIQRSQQEPKSVDAFFLLAGIAKERGEFEQAISDCHSALNVDSTFVPAYLLISELLDAKQKPSEAIAFLKQACEKLSASTEIRFEIAKLCLKNGNAEQAIEALLNVLAVDKSFPHIHLYLAQTYDSNKQFVQAIEQYEFALNSGQENPESIQLKLGQLSLQLKDLNRALQHFNNVLQINARSLEALNNIGSIYFEKKQFKEAIKHYKIALSVDTSNAELQCNLGVALQNIGEHQEAIACFRRAISYKETLANAHFCLANSLSDIGQLDQAIDHYQRAIKEQSDFAGAHCNLGFAFRRKGLHDEALNQYKKAHTLNPDLIVALSNVLFVLSYHPKYTPQDYMSEARKYGQCVTKNIKPYSDWLVDSTKQRGLRVGMVSGDFRTHPVSFFLESVVARLDKQKIELFAYATSSATDALTHRLQANFSGWRCIEDMNDAQAAELIRNDQIDILIDLSGHSGQNRLPVFAYKPAPIQVNWLGYLASSGVPGMDYILADHLTAPFEHQPNYTEKIWHFPTNVNCLTPPSAETELLPKELPALKNKQITYGNFQNLTKISDESLATWCEVLRRDSEARLHLHSPQFSHAAEREFMLKRFDELGIALTRVSLFGKTESHKEHLARHGDVDIILDTFPYPGITTTFEALWMGVPSVVMTGNTLLSRQGPSILQQAGLSDWVAADVDTYVEIAIQQSKNIDNLVHLRNTLRTTVLATTLFNAVQFAAYLEQTFFEMRKIFVEKTELQSE